MRISIGERVKFNQEVKFYGEGTIEIKDDCYFGHKIGGGYKNSIIEIQARNKNSEIIINENVAMNNGVFICANKKITIMNNCLIGRNVTLMDHNGHGIKSEERRTYEGTAKSIYRRKCLVRE